MAAVIPTTLRLSTPPRPAYRHDLDGLRGIAIALVVFFHVFVGRVSGGVDVFLLLSGYFFLGSQIRYASKPNALLNPWWPIWRTLRRLVPSLATILLATALAVFYLTPELLTPDLTKQFTAAMGYYLNWALIDQEAAYAAAAVDTSPLQHLWSMSIQGQFYLIGILFALFLGWRKLQRYAGPVLIMITIASFAWASRFGFIGSPDSYYSLFSRAWELTLGGVIAIYGHKITLPHQAATVGLVMIVMTGVVIPTSLAFPGPAALLPITGAVLIILTTDDGPTTRILTSAPAQWVGGMAYTLYLWHWPLLIVLTAYSGLEKPTYLLGIGVIAASLALADMTHRYIEAPLRQHAKRPTVNDAPNVAAKQSLLTFDGRARAIGGIVTALMVAAVFSVQPMYQSFVKAAEARKLDPVSYPGAMAYFREGDVFPAPPQPNIQLVGGIYPAPGNEGCMVFKPADGDTFADDKEDGTPCVYGDVDAKDSVVVAGGSHAEPWIEPLDLLGKQNGFKVVPFLRQECPVVLGSNYGVYPACQQWSELAVERIIDLHPLAVVSTSTRPKDSTGQGPDFVPEGYKGFWSALDDAGIPFIGLRDNPWIVGKDGDPVDSNLCLAAMGMESQDYCGVPRDTMYAPTDPAKAAMESLKLAVAVDTSDWYCDADYCFPIVGNVPVYRDQNHISNAYALSAAPLLWSVLEPVIR